jgi:hypothetical protein
MIVDLGQIEAENAAFHDYFSRSPYAEDKLDDALRFYKRYPIYKNEILPDIKEKFEKELSQYKDFLDGKRGIYFYYFSDPRLFELDIKDLLSDDHPGKLSPADLAWIEDTRELVKKHNAVCKNTENITEVIV